MLKPSRTKIRILVSLICMVVVIGIIWLRACGSAKEHYLKATSLPRMSTEQITELKRSALFRVPFNFYASAALAELEIHLNNPAVREAFCEALYGSRHPFWQDERALKSCMPSELSAIRLKEEASLSFKGNALTSFTFTCWMAGMFGLIFRGFSNTGTLTKCAKRWSLIAATTFIAWCASLVFV